MAASAGSDVRVLTSVDNGAAVVAGGADRSVTVASSVPWGFPASSSLHPVITAMIAANKKMFVLIVRSFVVANYHTYVGAMLLYNLKNLYNLHIYISVHCIELKYKIVENIKNGAKRTAMGSKSRIPT